MKSILPFIACALLACSNPSADKGTEANDLPADAIREKFSDAPGFEKITVNNVSGKPILQGTLVNGKKEGTWTVIDPNGLIKSTTSYVGGEREGNYIEFSSSGNLLKRISYHKNRKHGEYREYFSINIKESRFYQNDKLEDTVKIYYTTSLPMEKSAYKNGLRDGISIWYDQDGKVSIQYTYKNGELIK